jgi:hypothetical protein
MSNFIAGLILRILIYKDLNFFKFQNNQKKLVLQLSYNFKEGEEIDEGRE